MLRAQAWPRQGTSRSPRERRRMLGGCVEHLRECVVRLRPRPDRVGGLGRATALAAAEHLWSRAGATGGNRSQMAWQRKRLETDSRTMDARVGGRRWTDQPRRPERELPLQRREPTRDHALARRLDRSDRPSDRGMQRSATGLVTGEHSNYLRAPLRGRERRASRHPRRRRARRAGDVAVSPTPPPGVGPAGVLGLPRSGTRAKASSATRRCEVSSPTKRSPNTAVALLSR